MPTHTSGPWTVKEGYEHSEDCPLNVWAPGGIIVAAIVGMGDELLSPATEEGHANARLIAAAPTMLAALTLAAQNVTDRTAERAIRAAIAAATGEG